MTAFKVLSDHDADEATLALFKDTLLNKGYVFEILIEDLGEPVADKLGGYECTKVTHQQFWTLTKVVRSYGDLEVGVKIKAPYLTFGYFHDKELSCDLFTIASLGMFHRGKLGGYRLQVGVPTKSRQGLRIWEGVMGGQEVCIHDENLNFADSSPGFEYCWEANEEVSVSLFNFKCPGKMTYTVSIEQ